MARILNLLFYLFNFRQGRNKAFRQGGGGEEKINIRANFFCPHFGTFPQENLLIYDKKEKIFLFEKINDYFQKMYGLLRLKRKIVRFVRFFCCKNVRFYEHVNF